MTSFKKKGTEIRRIPGTKFSYRKSQLLTSTGNTSLDSYLGGGLSVGTLIIVEGSVAHDDVYLNALLRYYLAEGVTNNHSLFIAEHTIAHCDRLLENLPAEVKKKKLYGSPVQDDLSIAWRYKNQQSVEDNQASVLFQRKYDFTESMCRLDFMNRVSVVECDILNLTEKPHETNSSTQVKEPYSSILARIKDTLEKRNSQCVSEHSLGASLLRIAIASLGSPLWSIDEEENDSHLSLLRFLCILKSLLRSSYAVAFVTMSSDHFKDEKLPDKIYQMADYVVKLISFEDSANNKNPMTKGFDGLFQILKLPHLNSPMYQVPTTDLAFKLNARKFEIKRLHLPPCIDDSASGDTSFGCASGSKKLEF